MKNWEWGTANTMDPTCTECERLLQEYENATHCQLIIERHATRDTGLDVIVRKASNRCEKTLKAFEDHEATHMTATVVASATS